MRGDDHGAPSGAWGRPWRALGCVQKAWLWGRCGPTAPCPPPMGRCSDTPLMPPPLPGRGGAVTLPTPAPVPAISVQMREEDYGALVDAENVNRIAAEDGAATSVEGALAMLGVKDKEDRHPEKWVWDTGGRAERIKGVDMRWSGGGGEGARAGSGIRGAGQRETESERGCPGREGRRPGRGAGSRRGTERGRGGEWARAGPPPRARSAVLFEKKCETDLVGPGKGGGARGAGLLAKSGAAWGLEAGRDGTRRETQAFREARPPRKKGDDVGLRKGETEREKGRR
eukprot:363950-Chlamydomonas_euryale.AAC.8